jgi:hypothetical protein
MLDKSEITALTEILDALDHDGYRKSAAWEAAHNLAQEHEGEAEFDWLHALCHRIEGDQGNAAYWYRRAGRPPFNGDFGSEAEAILASLGGH